MAFDPRTHASPHFAWTEFACRDYFHSPYPVDWRESRGRPLAEALEAIRTRCGQIAGVEVPLRLNSVYRTLEWNRICQGKKASKHLEGIAADILCPFALSYDDFRQAILDVAHEASSRLRYIQFYPHQGFVHVDIRDTRALVIQEFTPPKDRAT